MGSTSRVASHRFWRGHGHLEVPGSKLLERGAFRNGLTPDPGLGILWVMAGSHIYEDRGTGMGWTPEHCETWLGDTLVSQRIADRGGANRPPVEGRFPPSVLRSASPRSRAICRAMGRHAAVWPGWPCGSLVPELLTSCLSTGVLWRGVPTQARSSGSRRGATSLLAPLVLPHV